MREDSSELTTLKHLAGSAMLNEPPNTLQRTLQQGSPDDLLDVLVLLYYIIY